MKHYIILFFITASVQATAQLTKGNWLIGGTCNFIAYDQTYTGPGFTTSNDGLQLLLSPGGGYFFAAKLAGGVRTSFTNYKSKSEPGSTPYKLVRFEAGPFLRYYFLKADNEYNLLADINYRLGPYRIRSSKGNIHTFAFSGGPVIYFNRSVGLEFLIGYYQTKTAINSSDYHSTDEQKGLQMSIGLQVHLAK